MEQSRWFACLLKVPTYRFRRFKLSYLASQFEQILLMLRKGELPIDNVIYFGFYAKNFFRQIKMENPKLLSLIDEWEYWTNVRKKAFRNSNVPICRCFSV
jgi:hypothetical protein